MSKTYHGGYRKSDQVVSNESKLFDIQTSDHDNIPTSEADFRGFEKVPLVLCERIDITPFLKKTDKPVPPAKRIEMITNGNLKNLNIDQLLKSCYVLIVRDDLEKLKKTVKNSSVNGVSCLKCKICDKTYSSERKLQNHQENKHIIYKSLNKTPKRVSFSDHIIVHEVTEYHRCRKCPKIFEDFNSLRTHMKQQHKKRKCYVCFYCSKDFVDRTFFKVHIKLHCDSCGLLLANKKKYLEHRRYVCRILKKYDCKTCNMSFFKYMDLKDHSYDHLGIFFICDICKDQFESKCAVAHHINFLHTKKHSNELYSKQIIGLDSIYTCNFCEENMFDINVIEKHVSILPDLQNRVMTGYKDYYFCDQCLSKFSTESDMLQHKWTHFMRSSDNSQERKDETVINKNTSKTQYKVGEALPDFLQPKLVLERIKIPETPPKQMILLDSSHFDANGMVNKTIIDPITKKTIISKFQCEYCSKYLSKRNSLNRHLYSVHGVGKEREQNSLQCTICEEVFVWPSLLQTHKCIRTMIPEMPFDDARPEVHFDNLNVVSADGFDDINMMESDDYMNGVDFEIPAPIVQLTEFEHLNIVVNGGGQLNIINDNKSYPLNNISYKVVMQEVPIEF